MTGSHEEAVFLRMTLHEMTDPITGEVRVIETRSPQEIGQEIGEKILGLLEQGGVSCRPYYFYSEESEEHSLMHRTFINTVGVNALVIDGHPDIIRTGMGNVLTRNPIIGVNTAGLEQRVGWVYDIISDPVASSAAQA